ncbi:MAG: hypothetical protein J6B23_09015 [Clostridia bacterium]|nr:hypothetical protein [Clostridia bacterium]
MAMKPYFVNNQTYGADDINAVMSRLTTSGVSLFNDSGNIISDLNGALSGWIDAGVEMYNTNACKVEAIGNGKYKIIRGSCWMPSGACVIFDNDGYIFEPNFYNASGVLQSTANVYLHQGTDNGISNDISVEAVPEAWNSTTDVPLATISRTSGVATDKRVFARAKIGVPTSNITQTFDVEYDDGDPAIEFLLSFDCKYIYNFDQGRMVTLSESFKMIHESDPENFVVRKTGNKIIIDLCAENTINRSNKDSFRCMVF